jgi:hypothetical protein
MSNILKVLAMLDAQNADHWTGEGLPRIDVLSALAGSPLTRDEVTKAAPAYTRTNQVIPNAIGTDKPGEAMKADGSNELRPPVGADIAEDKSDTTSIEDTARADARAALAELNSKLAEAYETQVQLANYITDLRKQQSDAQERLNEFEPKVSNAETIQAYLKSQVQVRADKVAAVAEIRRMGITAQMLQSGSPIDQAMRRKR